MATSTGLLTAACHLIVRLAEARALTAAHLRLHPAEWKRLKDGTAGLVLLAKAAKGLGYRVVVGLEPDSGG